MNDHEESFRLLSDDTNLCGSIKPMWLRCRYDGSQLVLCLQELICPNCDRWTIQPEPAQRDC